MKKLNIIMILILTPLFLLAQNRPYRVGTTAANFLEIGFGSAGAAMGDAYVTQANDVTGIYWNPAGLAFMEKSEIQQTLQPWVVDIHTSFLAAGIVIPEVGTLGFSFTLTDYGDMDVTTVQEQEGTGERFSASDYALSLAYARPITNWFAFGAAVKYIGSNVWHMNASALALDLGVSVRTQFFSPTSEREDGMIIAMSISNYGTRMKYDGMDLLQSTDISPDKGHYEDVRSKFDTDEWELPLIFRLGVGINALKTENQKITITSDALHPNNNAESVNFGLSYEYLDPTFGKVTLRSGYKGAFLEKDAAQYGLTFGGGIEKYFLGNIALKLDYAFRDIGILGNVHTYSIGFLF